SRFPRVFCEDTPRLRGCVPFPQLLLASDRVVHHATFGMRRVLRQVQQIVELEFGSGPRPLKRFHVVSKPPFVPELQRMRTANMSETVAPVVVVLEEVSLRKALAIEPAEAIEVRQTRYSHRWNGKVAGLVLDPFNTVLREDDFVKRRRIERVGIVDLEGALPVLVRRGELRNGRWSTEVQGCAEKAAVNSIVLEVLVYTDEILVAIAEIAGVENTRVNHGRGTRQVIGCCCSTGTGKDVIRGFRYGAARQPRRGIGIQDFCPESPRDVL